jgi:hypothetical protein
MTSWLPAFGSVTKLKLPSGAEAAGRFELLVESPLISVLWWLVSRNNTTTIRISSGNNLRNVLFLDIDLHYTEGVTPFPISDFNSPFPAGISQKSATVYSGTMANFQKIPARKSSN